MPTSAMLYCQDIDALDFDVVARAAGLERVEPFLDQETGATRVELKLGDVQVILLAVPRDEMRQQVDELEKYIEAQCGPIEPWLRTRLAQVSGALELAFLPTLDPAGACVAFVRELARTAQAFVFRDDGVLEDATGEVLARPRAQARPLPRAAPPKQEPFPELTPPPAERVARRALVVVSLAWRSVVERRKPDNRAELVAGYHAWLERLRLWDEMEAGEDALARAEAGAWTETDANQASWGIEGAAVLAWALRLSELPAHDVQVDSSALGRALGLFADAPPALAAPGLRPVAELDWMVRRLVGLHWRLRSFMDSPGRVDFAEFARECLTGGFDPAGIRLAKTDLAIGEQPIWAASERAIAPVLSIALERHRAATWLGGISPSWSGTPAIRPGMGPGTGGDDPASSSH